VDNHRDDRDFFAALEVHTPSLLPGIRGAVSFHRSWNKPRITRFKEAILRASHLSEGDLHEVIQEADSKADLLTVTASRVNDRGDRQYSDLLARLVAAALVDDSKIDVTAYIVDRIVQLEPVHLRILAAVRTSDLVGQGIKELPEAARRAEREKWDSTDPIVVYSDIHIERLGAAEVYAKPRLFTSHGLVGDHSSESWRHAA